MAVAALCAAAPGSRTTVVAQNPDSLATPNFDARILMTGADVSAGPAAANAALDGLRRAMPDVAATVDGLTGVTRTLYNSAGYLSEATAQDTVGVALDFARAQAGALGIDAGDVAGAEVTDVTVNRTTGSTHVYLRQRIQGLPVYNGQLQVNVNRSGRVISVNNAFHPTPALTAALTLPLIPADAAVRAAAAHLLLGTVGAARVAEAAGPERHTTVAAPEVSLQPVTASLMWLPVRRGDLRLVWNFQIHTLDGNHVYDMTVDAGDSQVMTRFDWTSADQYRVYPYPA
jgi:extracellular elastinolytic metalloproteinase